MLVRSNATTFLAKALMFKLQDNTTGTLDIEFKKLDTDRVDQLFDYEDTRVAEVFDEVVAGVRGIADQGPDGKPVLLPEDVQLAEARRDPAIVQQCVEHFFQRMQRVRPGEKTLKKSRQFGH